MQGQRGVFWLDLRLSRHPAALAVAAPVPQCALVPLRVDGPKRGKQRRSACRRQTRRLDARRLPVAPPVVGEELFAGGEIARGVDVGARLVRTLDRVCVVEQRNASIVDIWPFAALRRRSGPMGVRINVCLLYTSPSPRD